jgi:hypothetical protein
MPLKPKLSVRRLLAIVAACGVGAWLAKGWLFPNRVPGQHVALIGPMDIDRDDRARAKEDHNRMDHDIELIDAYLAKWDRFARSDNSLKPELKRDEAAFGAALGRALTAKDRRAPSRLIFWAVVRVGGGIPVDSDLGKAVAELLGPDFPVRQSKEVRFYFASDLYFWWLEHQKQYEPYLLFDEWAKREFARKTVIPNYNRLREKENEKQRCGN